MNRKRTIESYFGKPIKKANDQMDSKPEPAPSKEEPDHDAPAPAAADGPSETAEQAVVAALSAELRGLIQDPTWSAVLRREFDQPYFESLEKFIKGELDGGKSKVYPPKEHIFRAFNSCPFDKVKVVILGQDPYHGPRQAMGLSFSVPPGVQVPSSLQNIFKELRSDLGCSIPPHGDLRSWADQGVLLLNAVLTVRAGEAASHSKRGWEQLTDSAIRQLSLQRSGVVFLLWGRFAQDKAKLIDSSRHHVLTAAHPSGLSAHRGFFGCKHFSQANQLLIDSGQQPIDWSIK